MHARVFIFGTRFGYVDYQFCAPKFIYVYVAIAVPPRAIF